jgi:hypothetical protein
MSDGRVSPASNWTLPSAAYEDEEDVDDEWVNLFAKNPNKGVL